MNYPPGVTGAEPQITGEWPVDPHAPFSVLSPSVGDPAPEWIVVLGNEEDPVGSLVFTTEAEAERFAADLNRIWPNRACQPSGRFQQCRICGDIVA